MTYSITHETLNLNEVIREILGSSGVSARLKRFFCSLLRMNIAGEPKEKVLPVLEGDEEAKETYEVFFRRTETKIEDAKGMHRVYDRKGDLI